MKATRIRHIQRAGLTFVTKRQTLCMTNRVKEQNVQLGVQLRPRAARIDHVSFRVDFFYVNLASSLPRWAFDSR